LTDASAIMPRPPPPMIPAPRTGSPRWPGDKSVPAAVKPETGERIIQEAGSHRSTVGPQQNNLICASSGRVKGESATAPIGGSARLPGGGSNTFGDLQAAIIIAHVRWLPTGAVLGCHDDISRGDRARGPAATAHGRLTARCHIHGDLAGRGINRAVVAAVVDVTRLHRRLSFAPHGRASRFVACKRNAPMTARVTAAPSASLAIWGGRLRDPTRSLTANGSLARPAHLPALHASHSVARSHTLDVP
jgi:hypothetical protein